MWTINKDFKTKQCLRIFTEKKTVNKHLRFNLIQMVILSVLYYKKAP